MSKNFELYLDLILNDGIHNKMVKEDELNFYLNNVWVKGIIRNKHRLDK